MMAQKICRICFAGMGAVLFTALLVWVILLARKQACQEAADIVAAVRVCQQSNIVCWSAPSDLADMRRALRRLEECR